MSAKGRPKNGELVVSRDTQETPAWVVHRLLDWVAPLLPKKTTWLEPCAGRGAIINAVEEYDPALVKNWLAFEIDHRAFMPASPCARLSKARVYNADFFTDASWAKVQAAEPTVCIQNPPFGLALDFAKWGLAACRYNFSILRLNWIETPERHEFFRETNPALAIFSDRPSFDGFGTDATAYAWFCWGLGEKYDGTWRLLDLTSKEIRKEANRESRKRAGVARGPAKEQRVPEEEVARSNLARNGAASHESGRRLGGR